jgi:CubicO group peptidase (beta-lactamase class C family)
MVTAKTVTAMFIGIAIVGRIRSVDDPAAAYVPALAGTEYGRTSLRHLLQMSSGVRFVEEYRENDDVSRLVVDTFRQIGSGGVEAVTPFNVRVAPSGTRFYYASIETQVLGLVLRSAVGRPVADYLHEKIWEPMGAEADASWLIDRAGQEAERTRLVMVHTAVRKQPRDPGTREENALWRSFVQQLGH